MSRILFAVALATFAAAGFSNVDASPAATALTLGGGVVGLVIVGLLQDA